MTERCGGGGWIQGLEQEICGEISRETGPSFSEGRAGGDGRGSPGESTPPEAHRFEHNGTRQEAAPPEGTPGVCPALPETGAPVGRQQTAPGDWNGQGRCDPSALSAPSRLLAPAPRSALEAAGTCPGDAENGRGSLPADGAQRSDEALVEAICGGEEAALAELWRRYRGLLASQALRVLQSTADADDAVAEVFEEVWARPAGYHAERARPVAWLLTLVRRRSIDRLRVRNRHRRTEAWMAAEGERCTRGGEGSVEGELRRAELRDLLTGAMDRLPEKQRVTVWMAYYRGCSHREIAQQTGCPVGTVKTRLESALRKMREGLCPGRDRGSP